MIEMTKIPTLEHEISIVEGWIDQLTEEIGTNLTLTFGRGPQHAGAAQKDSSGACFSQTEVVAKVSLKRQKLQSLLDDNLMKWCQELLSFNVYNVSNYQKRCLYPEYHHV